MKTYLEFVTEAKIKASDRMKEDKLKKLNRELGIAKSQGNSEKVNALRQQTHDIFITNDKPPRNSTTIRVPSGKTPERVYAVEDVDESLSVKRAGQISKLYKKLSTRNEGDPDKKKKIELLKNRSFERLLANE